MGGRIDVILVADNLRVTNKEIEDAIQRMDPEPIREMVRRCEAAGAEAIDINSGPLPRDPEGKMEFLVRTVQDTTDLPVLLDTVNPKALLGGLRVNGKRAIINGFSLQPSKLKEILPLAASFEAEIIGYLLRPDGRVPTDGQERLSIAVELFMAYRETGAPEERLIIDPVVVPVAWDNGVEQAKELLSVVHDLPEALGFPVRTIAGISNLTAGAKDREKRQLLEGAYLPMLAASGLSMALLDIFNRPVVQAAKASRMLLGEKPFAWAAMD